MTPHDVVTDPHWLRLFQQRTAYSDRAWPSDEEAHSDSELLNSGAGTLIVAWLWPSDDYRPDDDPLDTSLQADHGRWKREIDKHNQTDAKEFSEAATCALDRFRENRRRIAAKRFEGIIESTAREVNCSIEDVKTHLVWSGLLSQLELERLLGGLTPFPFHVIVGLCDALRLEFTDAWFIDQPLALARHIELSVRATSIAEKLRLLSLENLASVEKRLPQRPISAGPPHGPDSYRAPEPGGRYSALYEVLVADERDQPEYTLAQIDRVLIDADEPALPDSARKSRSWWAGSGARSEGRPQVSAWWGAGYRVTGVAMDSVTEEMVSVKFEALPLRADWLSSPQRTSNREYRPPGPDKVRIYPDLVSLREGKRAGFSGQAAAVASQFDSERFREGISPALKSLESLRRSVVPKDIDVRRLTQFLDGVGEANRSQIERHFSEVRSEPFDAPWLTNLLTKARRQGWIVNKGTRKQPWWAALRLRAVLLDDLTESLRLEPHGISANEAIPAEFLQTVAEAVDLHCANSSPVQVARAIIESSGGAWLPGFESADGSVTALALKAISDAVGMRMPAENEIIVLP